MRAALGGVVALLIACHEKPSPPAVPPAPNKQAELIQQAEAVALKHAAQAPFCGSPVEVFSGSIEVAATGYEGATELDRVVTKAERVSFTLDYPFEKPFAGTVIAPITLRRIVDAIRAGFRTMYEGAEQRDIPGLMNKDVRGVYGRSFHAIGDLVIESVQLCADGRLDIDIGS